MLRPRVSVSRRPPASWQMFEGFRWPPPMPPTSSRLPPSSPRTPDLAASSRHHPSLTKMRGRQRTNEPVHIATHIHLLFEMQRQKTHTQERVKEEQARKLRK